MFHEAYKTGDDALFAQFPDDLLELTEHQQTLVRHGGVGGGILTLYPQCWGVCVGGRCQRYKGARGSMWPSHRGIVPPVCIQILSQG